MSTIPRLIWSLAVILAGAALISAATAAENGPQAKIVRIVGGGQATVEIAGAGQPAVQGMDLPLGAVVVTGGQEVYVEVATGVVATVAKNSRVVVKTLSDTESVLELRQGRLVSHIDKNRPNKRTFKVATGQGVAAARGTGFGVSVTVDGTTITTTADSVEFVTAAGARVVIAAGQLSYTPPGATVPNPPLSIAAAAQSSAEVRDILNDAVTAAATVVQNNLGSISADSATSLLSQVAAVAVAAMPTEATTITQTLITAVTSAGSATAGSAAGAAGAVTAAAVAAAPTQAAAIAGAAAAAAPEHAGVITASAQQVAPTAKDAITDNVATSTGQSKETVQSNADTSTAAATSAVNTAKDATSNVVTPTAPATQTPSAPGETQSNTPKTSEKDTTPVTPVDPGLNVSPAT